MEEHENKRENKDNVTISKDVLYGGIIAVLALLLVGSIFTHGYGIVACPFDGTTEVAQPAQPTEPSAPTEPTEPAEPAEPALPALPTLTVEEGTLPARGGANADVMIDEFSDFQCPFCKKLFKEGGAQVKTNYVDTGKVKYYFRDFPLGFHPNAVPTSIAARCAADQNKYWEMHDKLYDTQSEWTGLSDVGDSVKGYAADLGLDTATFDSCYDSQEHVSEINLDYAAGQSYGVQGTPSSFIVVPKSSVDGKAIRDAVDSLNVQYGDGLTLFENNDEYTVMIPGAYPYDAFDGVLSVVNY